MKNQLELITLTVTPEEARIIASDLAYRAVELMTPPPGVMAYTFNGESAKILADGRTALRRKVEFQAGVSTKP